MSFEDRLLAELKTEVADRASRRRGTVRRRWRTAGRPTRVRWRPVTVAAAAVAVLAALAVPTLIGPEATAAYAVTRNADGSITVTVKELRAAARLQAELADDGARTDITYLPQHMRCTGERGAVVDQPAPPTPSKSVTKMSDLPRSYRDMLAHQPLVWPASKRSFQSFKIFPQRIKPGQTLVVELAESHRTKLWKLGSYLVAGPVRPCVFENDPYWN
ncbi:hypothetical protein [Actinoallomurus sp. CA-142502]|uniref:hypothetical protein n=1 Tax=Actinoallomurus sp. CA-142502 TaxID=3239885 RepID=UPI003D908F3D